MQIIRLISVCHAILSKYGIMSLALLHEDMEKLNFNHIGHASTEQHTLPPPTRSSYFISLSMLCCTNLFEYRQPHTTLCISVSGQGNYNLYKLNAIYYCMLLLDCNNMVSWLVCKYYNYQHSWGIKSQRRSLRYVTNSIL